MKKRKLTAMLAAVMTLSLVFSACGSAKPATKVDTDLTKAETKITEAAHPEKLPTSAKNRKDTLVIGVTTPDGVLNPLYNESAYDMYIVESMFDALIDIDPQGNPIPGLSSWTISSDGLKYTFKIKDGVKFSDGTPVTADDVAFTFDVMCDPSYTGVQDPSVIGVKGWEAYQKGTAKSIEGLKVIDSKTIEFDLEKPNASAIYYLGFGILSKAYYGKDYKQGNTKGIEALHHQPMGCGAFKLTNYKEGQEFDLVANDSYWKGAPKIKNVIYKAISEDNQLQQLFAGDIDITDPSVNPENINQIKDAGFITTQVFPTNGYGYIGMNFADPLFQDVKVRQALTYGLNRAQVVESVYHGYANVCNEPASTVGWTYNSNVDEYKYDADKAKKLLDEAGWKVGSDGIREKDGKKLEIHFLASTPNSVNTQLVPIAEKCYSDIGVKFVAEQMEFNSVLDKIKKPGWQMYFMAWGLTADPDVSGILGTNGPQNRTHYSNKTVDDLCAKGLEETDKTKRKAIYQELWKTLNQDLPYIFMYQRRDMWAVSCRVKGIETTPFKDFTYSLWNATLK